MKKFLTILLCIFLLFPMFVFAEEKKEEGLLLAKDAKSAVLMEASTGEIIFEKNADEKLAPASMTKLMAMLLIIENIERGVIKWDEMVTVSEAASSLGGSQILLDTGERMSVEDLFKGVAIASGNDAVVALAEKIAGTEEIFVGMMNDRAKELGLTNSNFKNTHGLDEANHYSSARDMATISRELVKYDKVLEYTKIYETYLRENLDTKVWLVNTNKLVRFYEGVDGLKTGFTDSAGFCLSATAKRDGMRLIAVVMGSPTGSDRNAEISEMLDYGFAQYSVETMLTRRSILGKKEVEKGLDRYVEVVPAEDITFLNKKMEQKKNASYKIKMNRVSAPIKRGDKIGTIYIYENNNVIREVDLTVKQDVKKANIFRIYLRYLNDIVSGKIEL